MFPVRAITCATALGIIAASAHAQTQSQKFPNRPVRFIIGLAPGGGLDPLSRALAQKLGLEVHAGHGINFESVTPIAALPEVAELNIGHFLVGEGIFTGLADSIKQMRALMDAART